MTPYAMRRLRSRGRHITEVNGQDVVRRQRCDRYAYCAPRVETRRPVRTVRTRPDISPSQRAHPDERCAYVHGVSRDGRAATRRHLLSVEEGRKLGATDAKVVIGTKP